MTEPLKRFKPNTKMVPVPSRSIIPERDVNHSPVLEASHLGIEFGGLIGGASLKAPDFAVIVNAATKG